MDRSFLSQKQVIEAAKKFVSIRLTSYEDETEKAFIAKITRGQVANTSFAVLTPEGEIALRGRGPGRGPNDLFADADAMAKGMDELALKYPAKEAIGNPALPITLNPKVGLAVAAGDQQALIVVVGSDDKERMALEEKLAKFAWDPEFSGYYTFSSTKSVKQIPNVKTDLATAGILLIEPNIFGSNGDVVATVKPGEIESKLKKSMQNVLKKHVRIAKTRGELARKGLETGIYYETGIAVSGQGEARDRERYKQQLDQKKKGGGGK